jgi:hypothetical protein
MNLLSESIGTVAHGALYAINQSRLSFTLLGAGRAGLSLGRGVQYQKVIGMSIWFVTGRLYPIPGRSVFQYTT